MPEITMVQTDVAPYIETPLVPSLYLSDLAGSNVYMKLELTQPSGSFKSRGLGHMVRETIRSNPSKRYHFFSPSGGNAGCATAYASRMYGQECTVCVPTTTNPAMVERIRRTGAKVILHGNYIAESDKYIQTVLIPQAKQTEGDSVVPVYCHPYNHPWVWEGNSSLASELVRQFGSKNKPDAVICSIGGGGLYNGLVQGFQKLKWNDVPIIAVETEGVATLHQSIISGTQVNLDCPKSIATSLSTANVTKETIKYATDIHPTKSVVVSDADAAEACIKFAADHKVLIEAACGTALAPIYKRRLKELLPNLNSNSNIVVIVCGGTSIDWNMLKDYSERFDIPL